MAVLCGGVGGVQKVDEIVQNMVDEVLYKKVP